MKIYPLGCSAANAKGRRVGRSSVVLVDQVFEFLASIVLGGLLRLAHACFALGALGVSGWLFFAIGTCCCNTSSSSGGRRFQSCVNIRGRLLLGRRTKGN